jgi:hypothetical protein
MYVRLLRWMLGCYICNNLIGLFLEHGNITCNKNRLFSFIYATQPLVSISMPIHSHASGQSLLCKMQVFFEVVPAAMCP